MRRLIQASTTGRWQLSTSVSHPQGPVVDEGMCPILMSSISNLRKEFQRKADDANIFSLFSAKANEAVWKTVRLDKSRTAAILVPIVSHGDKVSLLFTRRSSHMPTHANEVSFPGGHFDPTVDKTLEDTAIREAKEELGGETYPWDQVEIIGRASSLPSIKGTPVTPVLAVFPYKVDQHTFIRDPGEVEEIFCVGMQDLVDMETSEFSERFRSNTPVYPVSDNKKIWGLTAVVTRPLLHKLFKPVYQLQAKSKL